jgi:predicted anti-sigma-YlaC factor YlaD
MDCQKARELFTEQIDGALTGGAKGELEGHLASCASCTCAFTGLVEAREAAIGARRFNAPEGFAFRVMEKIRTLDDDPGASWLGQPSCLKLAQAAAAAAVVFMGVCSADSFRWIVAERLREQEASLVASVSAEYLDPVPPDSMGEMYLSIEENGNEK